MVYLGLWTLFTFICALNTLQSFQLNSLSFQATSNRVSYKPLHSTVNKSFRKSTSIFMGTKKRAWAKGDLNDQDIFDDDNSSALESDNKKPKFKLEPETTFFEGPPSLTEVAIPFISILTVIGIIPFIAAVSRQIWVKYKFTSRRISIKSGVGGNTQTEIIYPDIDEIRYVYRAFGSVGDMVLFLKDGAKVELRHVPNFNEIYTYVLNNCEEECRQKSMKLTLAKPAQSA